MKIKTLLLSFLLSGGAVVTLQSCGPAYVSVVPVRPYYAQTPSPYYGAIWIDGGWNYNGGYYHQGSWARPQLGRTYYPGQWNHGRRGYSYQGGRWR